MRSSLPLNRTQKAAMDLLHAARHPPGVITSGRSQMCDGQAWINWKTAYALHDRGVVVVRPYGEAEAEIYLDEDGAR